MGLKKKWLICFFEISVQVALENKKPSDKWVLEYKILESLWIYAWGVFEDDYLPRFLLSRNWWVTILQWCIHLQRLMGSWEPIKMVLWGSWYFNENYYPFLRVINGTFNHLLGTKITRVILSRNRVGTENRVLWKVGFKLIPNDNQTMK